MSNKVKGLLKGLRYISQIFEEEEEQEMQIGNPTDVKHVAHIGWDGPTASAPSWIEQFKDGDSEGTSQNGDQQEGSGPRGVKIPGQGKRSSNTSESSTLESPSRRRSSKTKGSKRNSSASETPTDSPRRSSSKLGPSENRTKSSSGPDSPTRDTTTSSSKTSRRRKPKTSSKSKPASTTPDLSYSDPGLGPTDDNTRRIRAM